LQLAGVTNGGLAASTDAGLACSLVIRQLVIKPACQPLRRCLSTTVRRPELNRDQIGAYVNRSLMLVTALSPVIGYDKASAIAHKASDEGTTLREAALATGCINAADFDRIVNPAAMVGTPQNPINQPNGDS
jgi:fumarate hydratase class II